MSLYQALHDETVRLEKRVKFNRAMHERMKDDLLTSEHAHEYYIIAHTQEVVLDSLRHVLMQYAKAK
jgi:hypothetical protein